MSPDEHGGMQRKVDPPAARGSECPGESEWPMVAAGLRKGYQAETLLWHAAMCDHCGPLLRQSVADFSGDTTAEEESMLTRLESSQPQWQQRMAARLAKQQERGGVIAWLSKHLLP